MSGRRPAATVEAICERVWLAIAERRLRPGTRLKEEQLAEIFEVSRARIRQAFAALERDGLIVLVPHRGACVAEPTIDEAQDVFFARRAIEKRVVDERQPTWPPPSGKLAGGPSRRAGVARP